MANKTDGFFSDLFNPTDNTELVGKINQLEQRANDQEAQINNLTGLLSQATDTIIQLDSELNSALGTIDTLQTNVNNATITIQSVQDNVSKATQTIDTLQSNVDNATFTIQNVQDSVGRATSTIDLLQTNVDKALSVIDGLQNTEYFTYHNDGYTIFELDNYITLLTNETATNSIQNTLATPLSQFTIGSKTYSLLELPDYISTLSNNIVDSAINTFKNDDSVLSYNDNNFSITEVGSYVSLVTGDIIGNAITDLKTNELTTYNGKSINLMNIDTYLTDVSSDTVIKSVNESIARMKNVVIANYNSKDYTISELGGYVSIVTHDITSGAISDLKNTKLTTYKGETINLTNLAGYLTNVSTDTVVKSINSIKGIVIATYNNDDYTITDIGKYVSLVSMDLSSNAIDNALDTPLPGLSIGSDKYSINELSKYINDVVDGTIETLRNLEIMKFEGTSIYLSPTEPNLKGLSDFPDILLNYNLFDFNGNSYGLYNMGDFSNNLVNGFLNLRIMTFEGTDIYLSPTDPNLNGLSDFPNILLNSNFIPLDPITDSEQEQLKKLEDRYAFLKSQNSIRRADDVYRRMKVLKGKLSTNLDVGYTNLVDFPSKISEVVDSALDYIQYKNLFDFNGDSYGLYNMGELPPRLVDYTMSLPVYTFNEISKTYTLRTIGQLPVDYLEFPFINYNNKSYAVLDNPLTPEQDSLINLVSDFVDHQVNADRFDVAILGKSYSIVSLPDLVSDSIDYFLHYPFIKVDKVPYALLSTKNDSGVIIRGIEDLVVDRIKETIHGLNNLINNFKIVVGISFKTIGQELFTRIGGITKYTADLAKKLKDGFEELAELVHDATSFNFKELLNDMWNPDKSTPLGQLKLHIKALNSDVTNSFSHFKGGIAGVKNMVAPYIHGNFGATTTLYNVFDKVQTAMNATSTNIGNLVTLFENIEIDGKTIGKRLNLGSLNDTISGLKKESTQTTNHIFNKVTAPNAIPENWTIQIPNFSNPVTVLWETKTIDLDTVKKGVTKVGNSIVSKATSGFGNLLPT